MTDGFAPTWTFLNYEAASPPPSRLLRNKIGLWEEEFNVWAKDALILYFPYVKQNEGINNEMKGSSILQAGSQSYSPFSNARSRNLLPG